MSEWQPIETLPDSGVGMIIYLQPRGDGKLMVGLGYKTVSGYWCDSESGFRRIDPTHWMPLPEPSGQQIGKIKGMSKLHETEKDLHEALCNFCNSARDPFTPRSQWDAEVGRNLNRLCCAYNDWYVWLKNTGRDPWGNGDQKGEQGRKV